MIPDSVPFEGLFAEVSLEANEDSAADNFKTTNPVLKDAVKDESKFGQLYEVSSSRCEPDVLGYHISSYQRVPKWRSYWLRRRYGGGSRVRQGWENPSRAPFRRSDFGNTARRFVPDSEMIGKQGSGDLTDSYSVVCLESGFALCLTF